MQRSGQRKRPGGRIALYYAATDGFVEQVELLIRCRAGPSIRDSNGESGKDVPDQLTIDLKGERVAIASYNQGIAVCAQAGDRGTADLLLANLHQEERHADFLETQLSLIKQLGLANYLAEGLKE